MTDLFWMTLSWILLLAAGTFAAMFLIFACIMVKKDKNKEAPTV